MDPKMGPAYMNRRGHSRNSWKRAGSSDIKELKSRLESVYDDLAEFLLSAMLKPCSVGEDVLHVFSLFLLILSCLC